MTKALENSNKIAKSTLFLFINMHYICITSICIIPIKVYFFIVFPTKFDFLITYRYLTTESGKNFTLSSQLSVLHNIMLKIPVTRGRSTRL